MTQHKHTQGKWEFQIDTGYIENNEGDIIGSVADSENICYAEAKANGILQAAAPDLLQACLTVRANLDPLYPEDHLIMKTLNAAINKAQGQS